MTSRGLGLMRDNEYSLELPAVASQWMKINNLYLNFSQGNWALSDSKSNQTRVWEYRDPLYSLGFPSRKKQVGHLEGLGTSWGWH